VLIADVGNLEKAPSCQTDSDQSCASGKSKSCKLILLVLSSRDRGLSCDESIVVLGNREKMTASQTNASKSSSSGEKTVKSVERTDPGRRQQQSCNGPATRQRRSADQERNNTASSEKTRPGSRRHSPEQVEAAGSSRHSGETLDVETSSYYTQRVAPVVDEMTRFVRGESSSRGMIRH